MWKQLKDIPLSHNDDNKHCLVDMPAAEGIEHINILIIANEESHNEINWCPLCASQDLRKIFINPSRYFSERRGKTFLTIKIFPPWENFFITERDIKEKSSDSRCRDMDYLKHNFPSIHISLAAECNTSSKYHAIHTLPFKWNNFIAQRSHLPLIARHLLSLPPLSTKTQNWPPNDSCYAPLNAHTLNSSFVPTPWLCEIVLLFFKALSWPDDNGFEWFCSREGDWVQLLSAMIADES